MMRGSANIKPDDIVNGSREATLGLLWSAFLQFQASWLEPCFKPLSTVWQPLLAAATVVSKTPSLKLLLLISHVLYHFLLLVIVNQQNVCQECSQR